MTTQPRTIPELLDDYKHTGNQTITLKKRKLEDLLEETRDLDFDLHIAKQQRLLALKKATIDRIVAGGVDPNTKPCSICMDKIANYALIPCGHKNFCERCVRSINKCSICQSYIDKRVRIFE